MPNPWGTKGRRRFPAFEEVRAWAYRELGDLDDGLPTIRPAYRTPPSTEKLDAVREACRHIAKARGSAEPGRRLNRRQSAAKSYGPVVDAELRRRVRQSAAAAVAVGEITVREITDQEVSHHEHHRHQRGRVRRMVRGGRRARVCRLRRQPRRRLRGHGRSRPRSM